MTVDLHHGPAVDVMRDRIATSSIDMIYSDPPFGNRQEWTGKAGRFSDRWSTTEASCEGWVALDRHCEAGASMLRAASGDAADRAYLGVMAGLLLECRRVMKPTATMWLHFDDTMGAYLRVLGDVVFGPALQIGTMIWRRANSHNGSGKAFPRVHDTIACFARSRAARWRLWRIGQVPGDPCSIDYPVSMGGFFETPPLASGDNERVGYPTQKPVALIEEIISAASLYSDLILDPTCGSGTTLVAARNLGRRAIGIDMSADAIAMASKRIQRAPARQMSLFGEVA